MPATISKRSRLNFVDLLSDEGYEYWDTSVYPEIKDQTDDLRYQVCGDDRIDMLAYKFYGTPTLWWVIAVANDLEILPSDLSVGQILRIPSPRYVNQELFKGLK